MSSTASRRRFPSFAVTPCCLLGLYMTSFYSFLLFHSLAEFLSILVAFSLFTISWNARRFLSGSYWVLLGIAYLWVGGIDILHTLAFKGMGVFPDYDTDLPTQFWIAARYMEALALFSVPLLIRKNINPERTFCFFLVVSILLIASIFAGVFPDCYLEKTGLTPFKKVSEYIICCILLASALLMLREKNSFEPFIFRLLLISIGLTIASELSFISYIDVYGSKQIIGHLLKLLSFYVMYRAVVVTSIIRPYDSLFRDLHQSRERLRIFIEHAPASLAMFDRHMRYLSVSRRWRTDHGLGEREIIGLSHYQLFPDTSEYWRGIHGRGLAGEIVRKDNDRIERPDGSVQWVRWEVRPWHDGQGEVAGIVIFSEDVTEGTMAREELFRSREWFQVTLNSIGDGVIATDASGLVAFLNPVAEKLTGWDSGEATGQPVENIFRTINDHTSQPSEDIVDRVLREGRTVSLADHTALVSRQGRTVPIEDSAAPITEKAGNVIGAVVVFHDVAEKRQIREALRESEQRFRLALRNAPVSVAAQGLDLRYIWAYNQKTTSPEGIIGRLDGEILNDRDTARMTAIKRRVIEENIEISEQMWLDRPNGRTFLDCYFAPICDEAGHVTGVGIATVDLTPIKLIEEDLRFSEEKFALAFANNPAAIAMTRLEDGTYLEVNDTWVALHGYSREEAVGNSARAMGIWPTAKAAERFVTELREKGSLNGWEQEFLKKSGIPYVAQLSAQVLTIRGEKLILTTLVDITIRKHIEQELRTSRDELESRVRDRTAELVAANQVLRNQAALLDLAHDAILVRGTDDTVKFWNNGAVETYGYPREEALGKPINELLRTKFPEPMDRILERLRLKGRWDGELIHTTSGGAEITVESRWALQTNGDGTPLGMLEINRNITARKQAQETVKAERQLFFRVLETMPAYVCLLTPDHHISFANRIFRERFGEAGTLRCFERLFGRSEPCEICETFQVFETMTPCQWDWSGPDGRSYNVFDFPFKNADGSGMIMEMGIDITEQKQAEAELRSTIARLELLNQELREFAFVASHDLQEPLRKILTFSDMAIKRCSSSLDGTGQEYLHRVMNSAARMRQLLEDLLQFSRVAAKPAPFRQLDLAEIAREAVDILEEKLKRAGGSVEIADMCIIEADEIQILRLFQNLIDNAVKFRGEAPPRIVVSAKYLGQQDCEIVVEDNGIGFDPQFEDVIFKPFQRLHGRKTYEGTGMGLAICRKIVERHGGVIRAESSPGNGSVFKIRLPVNQSRRERA